MQLDQRDDGDEIQDNLKQISGVRSVPQVFINGKSLQDIVSFNFFFDTATLLMCGWRCHIKHICKSRCTSVNDSM